MSTETSKIKLNQARSLMEDFASRTGINHTTDRSENRYLWTDAFAVQCFLGLFRAYGKSIYKDQALHLIDLVHEKLGKFHPKDERKGWISGFNDEKAKYHPTAGGLRIGKKLPERKASENFNERLEWEKDGQYFHYTTRWITSLLQTANETQNSQYSRWAVELLEASSKFLKNENSNISMYWKMSTDLSRPLVSRMGAQDPLEGLLCSINILNRLPDRTPELGFMLTSFKRLCNQLNWKTIDPLGIGGLLMSGVKAYRLKTSEIDATTLLNEGVESLDKFQKQETEKLAAARLAFRECGLSLGVRILKGMKKELDLSSISNARLQSYTMLADDIEEFWLSPQNQKASSWKDHLDINSVALASSLIASSQPEVFMGLPKE